MKELRPALRHDAVLKLKDQIEVVDGLADVLFPILRFVPGDILHHIPLEEIQTIGMDVFNGLDLEILVVVAALLNLKGRHDLFPRSRVFLGSGFSQCVFQCGSATNHG